MRNRRRHGRRGIGAVIGSLLLVAAVAIMGTFLVSWSSSSFAAQQLSISNQTDSRINLIKESFIIEDVWFYTQSGSFANVTIRNTGDLAIKVTHIYINNTQAWNTGEVIPIDGVAEIKVATSWGSGYPQAIWVKTDRGAEVKQTWKS